MLFFNFLCLFYLMVLINSHTISKNIAHDRAVNDIIESIHDIEYSREYRPKHDRLHRYYRKKEKEKDDAPKKEKEGEHIKITVAKLVSDTTEATKLTKAPKPILKSTKHLGFWQKLKNRNENKKSKASKIDNEVHKRKAMHRRRCYRKKQDLQSRADLEYDDTAALRWRTIPKALRNRHTNADKRKRDVSNLTTTASTLSTRSNINPFSTKFTSLLKLSSVKTYEPSQASDNITKALTTLSTRVNDLKNKYGLQMKASSDPTFATKSMTKVMSTATTTPGTTAKTTTEDVDYLATAQIEALLDDIKVKAVQMVAEQSPAITDIITNTVTETSFKADPILTHISSLGYALSTFIPIDNDSHTFNKRPVSLDTTTESKVNETIIIANTEPTHRVTVRSITEDVISIAQTIEDILQKNLKKVYKKVRGKVSPPLNKEVDHAKPTVRKETEKNCKKITQLNQKKQSQTSVTRPITTHKMKSNFDSNEDKSSNSKQMRRTPKYGKIQKNNVKTSQASTQSTFDDYVMLSLYEEILNKTHENNVMKMLATQNVAPNNRDILRIVKRDDQKVYDEVILPDELLDYATKSTNPYSASTESDAENISYEGLSNKISYNEYVNGYKHYLNFQRELGNQNFSNLVRYQAHRHHSIDDIGKFILNKIPQLPSNNRLKRFFDDDTMDDQDISTKSDDSWFKKHFYFFIDNGPPKKYHTSQTVELKSPITEPNVATSTGSPGVTWRPKNNVVTENPEGYGVSDKGSGYSIEDNLDQLSKALDERKRKEFPSFMPEQTQDVKKIKDTWNKENSADNGIFKSFGSIRLVDKLFKGKCRKNSKHNVQVYKETTENFEKEREKRGTKMNGHDSNDLYTDIPRIRPTEPNVIETRNKNYGYVDVNLIPRPTAIVKLRENTRKNGKFKKFLDKFHFRKKGKHTTKVVRAKREYRVQRFNPFKKLQDIFNVKETEKSTQSLDMPDYKMMTSHIDPFKPVKYNKIMSVEELKGQLPNITEELSPFHHDEALKSMEYPPRPEEVNTSPLADIKPSSSGELTGFIKPSSYPELKTNWKNFDNVGKFKLSQDLTHSFDMPEITYDQSTNKFINNYEITPLIDDLNYEINRLQTKLQMPDETSITKASTDVFTSPTAITNMPTRKMYVSETNNSSANKIYLPTVKKLSTKKMYVPSHLLSVQKLPKLSSQADPNDIQIQTKLTRIAKFPLYHLSHDVSLKMNPVIEKPQMYEYANEERNPHDHLVAAFSPRKRMRKKSLDGYSVRPSRGFNDFNKEDVFSKPYPDYFNDLLMWHGDLLNSDKLTTPQWEDVLKNFKQDAEVSTLSMTDMQRELMQIRDNLKLDESLRKQDFKPNKLKAKLPHKIKKYKTRSNSKKLQNIIKTVAFKDNTLAKGDDVIIQGESTYFHLSKQPQPDAQYLKASDLLNDLNKIYFKSPAIKYNIESKIHDSKRNDDFWFDISDTKNNNGKDQDSVLFLDTTLLAYDDGPDFLTDRPKQKKMSKYSPASSKLHQKVLLQGLGKPIAKTNKSPAQYFSTPLPMRMNDFERFLKENQLDVQSVTTPLVGMPKLILNKTPAKAHQGGKENQINTVKSLPKKVTLVSPSSFVTINPLNLNLYNNKKSFEEDKYTNKNEYANNEEMRQTRYSELRNERFFTLEPFKKLTSGKVKKKIKLFDKKTFAPAKSTMSNVHYTVIPPITEDDSEHEQVELTIINMNDVDPNYDSKHFNTGYTKPATPKCITTREEMTDRKAFKMKATKYADKTPIYTLNQKKHSNLLYKEKNKNKNHEKHTESMKLPQTTFNFENLIGNHSFTTTFHPVINDEALQTFYTKQPPKRVKISSNSYKYDIIYQEPAPHSNIINSDVKYGLMTPVPNYTDDLKLPYNILSSLIQTIRTSGRIHEIVKIVRGVEAVEGYTRPNVIIHIDLPTYHLPDTASTEKIVTQPKPKSMWNDFVMKYLSGIALIELLNKFGILKTFDRKNNFTDGVDNAVNASEVFSSAEYSGFEKELSWRTKSRIGRQVTGHPLKQVSRLETMARNWREKRRLKLFSNIKGKLKNLIRKKSNSSTTIAQKNIISTEDDKSTVATSFAEDHKAKTEKIDELEGEKFDMNDKSLNVDYEFNIDGIAEKATSDTGKAKNMETKAKDKNPNKPIDENHILSDVDIPDLSPQIYKGMSSNEYNKTSATFPDLIPQTSAKTTKGAPTATTTNLKNDPLSSISTPTTIKEKIKQGAKEEVYLEPLIYDSKVYVEPSINSLKPTDDKQTQKPNEGKKLQTKFPETKLEKRDIQPAGKFTAKDVAALEVIVDLVKNTVNSFEEQEVLQEFTESYCQNHLPKTTSTTPVSKSTAGSNSIQVHIAIPYNLQVDKKRSLESFKVKRVFKAKMFSPVDLEYQIQSFEDKQASTVTVETEDPNTPRLYLLIDANGSLSRENFPLRPSKGHLDFSKVRQVATTKAFSTEKSQTSSVNNIGRVTLSKDFVAAVNNHLVQLYENLTALKEFTSSPSHHIQVRDSNVSMSSKKKKDSAKVSLRRHLNWEAVKKYFGHDRVCNCKCKPNRTMCRACAATDAVISELIFEFENLVKYMNDHCTEIQTFFWMNPSGGKKLRDSVHKVDQTLHAYFKRVKGKCQGHTCKTFSTCIDKRSLVKKKKMPKTYIGNPMIIDLDTLANDIETTSNLGLCYCGNFIKYGEALMTSLEKCIRDVKKNEKSKTTTTTVTDTASTTGTATFDSQTETTKRMIKNVYSLDKINVNIICKPDPKVAIASSTAKMSPYEVNNADVTTDLSYIPNANFFDYESDDQPITKSRRFRNFFGNKDLKKYKNIFSYYTIKDENTTPMRLYVKRQTAYQVESPLVSDTFWKDYMKDNPLLNESTPKNNEDMQAPDPSITQYRNESDGPTSTSNNKKFDSIKSTSQINVRILTSTANPYPVKHVYQRDINTTDYASMDTLSHNINELFKIFHNLTDFTDIEYMSTQMYELTEKHTTIKPKQTSKQIGNTTKIFRNKKDNLHLTHKSNTSKTSANTTKALPKTTPTLDIKDDMESLNASSNHLPSKTKTSNISGTTTPLKSKMKTTSLNHKEKSSQASQKVEKNSQSESTKHETSTTKPAEGFKRTLADDSQKVTEKPAKPNFLRKLNLDFFHNKAKELRKTTKSLDVRKFRTPNLYSTDFTDFDCKKYGNSIISKSVGATHVIPEATSDENPTIIIMNEYGTDAENDLLKPSDHESIEGEDKNLSNEMNEDCRNLLLSILNYEAKKLDNEWKRINKDRRKVSRGYLDYDGATQDTKRGIFGLVINTESSLKGSPNTEIDYDLLKTLKEKLPTVKELPDEKKGNGLLQKIGNKFGVKVVSDPGTISEKPKTTRTQSPPPHQTEKSVPAAPTTEMGWSTKKLSSHKGEKSKENKLKANPKTTKLNPKYTHMTHLNHINITNPNISVRINSQEASKTDSAQICDVDATFKQIHKLIKQLPKKAFEQYISNKTCDKYKKMPNYFVIDITQKKRKKQVSLTKRIPKWNWIRSKRSLSHNKYRNKYCRLDTVREGKYVPADQNQRIPNKMKRVTNEETTEVGFNIAESRLKIVAENRKIPHQDLINDEIDDSADFVVEGSEYFEALERDRHGIYRSKKRRKRANNIDELETGLRNLPYLSKPNESYAMLGDTVVIECMNKINSQDGKDFKWITDRRDMLLYDNVVVEGPKLIINEVQAKNLGDYTCQKGDKEQRKVRLTITTLPTFNVIFTPFYKVDGQCTYEDLKAVQYLGPMMSKVICGHDQLCSVRIDEPVCLRDRLTNTPYLRVAAVLSVPPTAQLACSARCRRDAHCALALMVAAGAPALASVGVIIRNDNLNKTLIPSVLPADRRPIITHTLRRKDSVDGRDFYSHRFSLEKVNVIAVCPAGYYLIKDQRICAACPVGNWSEAGDNSCAARTSQSKGFRARLRRSYWWCPSCGWWVAGWGAACACAAVAALAHARRADQRGRVTTDVSSARAHSPRARPLSPSRVILAKFFRGSRSSTKATDSQFGLWKEKHQPPPLPPIDFDI